MKRFVSLVLSVCFLFSINTVSYAANTSSRKASNPVIQSMNDKYHVDFSGMSIDELNKFIDKMKDEDQTRASGNLLNNTQLAWLAAAQIARDKGYECAALKMKCKRKIMVGIAFVAVALCILFQLNTSGRKKSELIVEEVDLKNNCIYATAKNQLYDTDDNYIIYGASNYLKGNLQLSYLKEGESILVISNGKVLLSDPYQFDKIYSIQLLQ